MNKNYIKDGYKKFIVNGEYTHAFTLKPNGIVSSATYDCYRISTDETKTRVAYANQTRTAISNPIAGFSDNALRQRLLNFLARLDRRLIGSRFHLPKYNAMRSQAFVITEGSGTSAHQHGVLKVDDLHILAFNKLFLEHDTEHLGKQLWTSVSKGGTIDVKPLHDASGWADYMLKSFGETDFSDRIYITAKYECRTNHDPDSVEPTLRNLEDTKICSLDFSLMFSAHAI